jgi:NADH-quinone oxidoreductase subunit N
MKMLIAFSTEIFLVSAILLQITYNTSIVTDRSKNFPIIDKEIVFQTLLILFGSLMIVVNTETQITTSLLSTDNGTQAVKFIILSFSLPLVLVMGRAFVVQKINFGEFFTIFLLSVVGILILVSSTDFLVAYLALEMQALSFYVLACFRRSSSFSTDAGLKYFVLGSVVSGIYLMGCLLIYGGMGTLNFNALTLLLSFPLDSYSSELDKVVSLGVFLVAVSLMFKLAIVPFHSWAPDVYEGSPLCSTIGFSILPKIGLIYFFFKVINFFGPNFAFISDFLIISGCLSILIGTYLALRQTRLKRFLIYSSISQTGFFAIGLGLGTYSGFCSLFIYLILYVASSIVIWGFVVEFYSSQQRLNSLRGKAIRPVYISTVSNYFFKNKIASLLFIGLLFSIGGMPPSGGFLAKILILKSLVDADYQIVAVFVILISSISFFYYLRIIKIIFFELETIQESKELFQSTFEDEFSDLFGCLTVLTCLALYSVLFYPEFLVLTADLIVLGTKGY